MYWRKPIRKPPIYNQGDKMEKQELKDWIKWLEECTIEDIKDLEESIKAFKDGFRDNCKTIREKIGQKA